MDFPSPQKVSDLAAMLGCQCEGNKQLELTGLNEIHRIKTGELVFVDHPKYYKKALQSAAGCVLINQQTKVPEGKAILISEDPFRDFNRLIDRFTKFSQASSSISKTAKIGEGTIVQPNVFIGENVTIGKNCVIHSNVSIYDQAEIGDNVIIHGNTTIGSDAFYYKKRPEGYDKLKSCGKVVIGNDVEIGAGCTIDRGVTDVTKIGAGSKLDNLIQVGHDTVIGKNCLFASQVGIAGCVTIEDDVTLWGQVGVISDIVIGKGAVVLAQSGIGNSLEGNTTYFGSPAGVAKIKMKELAAIRKLPEAIKKLY